VHYGASLRRRYHWLPPVAPRGAPFTRGQLVEAALRVASGRVRGFSSPVQDCRDDRGKRNSDTREEPQYCIPAQEFLCRCTLLLCRCT